MIEIKGLNKSYPDRQVLRNASAVIKDGEAFTVIGPSGTGKSTLLRCIVRLLKPDSGAILVDGRDILAIKHEGELARLRKDFGYLFQEGALFDSLTVFENVSFGLKYLTDTDPSHYRRIVREKLALVGLKDVEDLKPAQLSGGMKKRVALARAIAAEPKYILYDEPTAGLDPVTSEMIETLIDDMGEKLGVTSVIVTHDIQLAFAVSDRIAVLDKGSFAVTGTPAELRASDNRIAREFIANALRPDPEKHHHHRH